MENNMNNDMVLILAEQLHKDCQEAIRVAKNTLRMIRENKYED